MFLDSMSEIGLTHSGMLGFSLLNLLSNYWDLFLVQCPGLAAASRRYWRNRRTQSVSSLVMSSWTQFVMLRIDFESLFMKNSAFPLIISRLRLVGVDLTRPMTQVPSNLR